MFEEGERVRVIKYGYHVFGTIKRIESKSVYLVEVDDTGYTYCIDDDLQKL